MTEQKRHHGSRRVPNVSERAKAELEEVQRRRDQATRKEVEEMARRQGWTFEEDR